MTSPSRNTIGLLLGFATVKRRTWEQKRPVFGWSSATATLSRGCGFHIHMHAFRNTFATVATQMGWNFERLRAAMGHSDYQVLQRYVRLATDRNLGPRKEWADFVLPPEEI